MPQDTLLSCLALPKEAHPHPHTPMVSLQSAEATSTSIEPMSSPRISFSTDFLDATDFISTIPNVDTQIVLETGGGKAGSLDFEFLSNDSASGSMITADELFFEGKLLPFRQMQQLEKLRNITLKPKEEENEENIMRWIIDEDPSPRPPKCTVIWKELLRLKKQRATSLYSSSSSSSLSSVVDMSSMDEGKEGKEGLWSREKHVKRIKKGLERTRSASIRVRPVVHVPICTQGKTRVLPPLFSLKKGNVEK